MRQFVDGHTHSLFSADSSMPLEEGIRAAIDNQLAGIAYTDHFDFDIPVSEHLDFTFDIDQQQQAIEKAADGTGLPDGFNVLKGIEIGIQPHCIESVKQLIGRHTFDQVILSLHFIDGQDPYYGEYYNDYDYKEAYGRYLETFLHCVGQFRDFNILGHFDYIARYSPYRESTIYYKEFSDIFDALFKILIAEGKTFEINTKTYQLYRGKEPGLDTDLLKRFSEMGGEAVSFGSDAHKSNRIGENFQRFAPILKSCGIRYTVYYKNGEPHFLPIA